MNNPCVRCGKQRIVTKEWKETIQTRMGPSVITHSISVCPDPKCQKIVEERQLQQKIKQEEITRAFKERAVQRGKARVVAQEKNKKDKARAAAKTKKK